MSNRYRRVSVCMWGDKNFRELSRPQPNAQTLWVYLLTGPDTLSIPGVLRASQVQICDELEWNPRKFRHVFSEIAAKKMIEVQEKPPLMWLPHALKHNLPANPNIVKGWRTQLEELPESPLRDRIFLAIQQFLKDFDESFQWPFTDRYAEELAKEYAKRFRKGSGNPSGKSLPIQDQDQDQDQDFSLKKEGGRELHKALEKGGAGGEREKFAPNGAARTPTNEAPRFWGEFQNVRLTEAEYTKLEATLGHSLVSGYIEDLSRWGMNEPAKFAKRRSHYATLLAWAARDTKRGGNGAGGEKLTYDEQRKRNANRAVEEALRNVDEGPVGNFIARAIARED